MNNQISNTPNLENIKSFLKFFLDKLNWKILFFKKTERNQLNRLL